MLNLTLDDYILALFSLVTIILIINSLNAYTETRNLRLINEELRAVIEAKSIDINRLQTEIQETSSTIINANQRSQTLENINRHQSERINHLEKDIQTLINKNARLNEILRCRPQPICQTEEETTN
jgi:translation initiation factor 2B subunit (eIF-2B alpha/beta/delta family)